MKKILFLTLACLAFASGGAFLGMQLRTSDDGEDCNAEPCSTEENLAETKAEEDEDKPELTDTNFIAMKNQFVIPIIRDENVTSFVVVSLSLEIVSGAEEEVYSQEPKLQDSLLRVMFDHAYMGGFNGAFTESQRMLNFRQALREAAKGVVGDDLLDVLITELVRQEV